MSAHAFEKPEDPLLITGMDTDAIILDCDDPLAVPLLGTQADQGTCSARYLIALPIRF
jgi:hypothetical protein